MTTIGGEPDRDLAAEHARRLIAECNWHGSFIQEIAVQSPSYFLRTRRSTVAADELPTIRLRLTLVEQALQGIEFTLTGVSHLDISFEHDLEPELGLGRDEATLSLGSAGSIRARRVDTTVLPASDSTYAVRYCRAQYFDPSGNPIAPGDQPVAD